MNPAGELASDLHRLLVDVENGARMMRLSVDEEQFLVQKVQGETVGPGSGPKVEEVASAVTGQVGHVAPAVLSEDDALSNTVLRTEGRLRPGG